MKTSSESLIKELPDFSEADLDEVIQSLLSEPEFAYLSEQELSDILKKIPLKEILLRLPSIPKWVSIPIFLLAFILALVSIDEMASRKSLSGQDAVNFLHKEIRTLVEKFDRKAARGDFVNINYPLLRNGMNNLLYFYSEDQLEAGILLQKILSLGNGSTDDQDDETNVAIATFNRNFTSRMAELINNVSDEELFAQFEDIVTNYNNFSNFYPFSKSQLTSVLDRMKNDNKFKEAVLKMIRGSVQTYGKYGYNIIYDNANLILAGFVPWGQYGKNMPDEMDSVLVKGNYTGGK